MCGIAGIISAKGIHYTDKELSAFTNTLEHRGPENKNSWRNENVFFGHQRLCIIDLTNAAAQPLHYLNRYTIIYNGEIYNYPELRSKLKKKGFEFKSESDTEVVVASYAAFGRECLKDFDGMFAFAIWDDEEKTLFAARDRFGEKPFFYSYDGETFVFASEMKALWQLRISKDVNEAMLYNFITLGYTTNPTDPQETFYNEIHKLPAAAYIEFHAYKNVLQVSNYWQVFVDVNTNISEAEAIENFKALFSESIRRRLRSDVEIGTSLSGGLDSSTIVAFCDKENVSHYTHKCFTASFEGFEKDESRFASLVANKFGLEHYFTTITEDEVLSLMEKVMHNQEEPFSSASVFAQYKVYQLAKQNGVTVLLDGQGADEVLGGYFKYYKWYWQELYRSNKLKSTNELAAARTLGVVESFNLKNKIAALLPDFTSSLLQSRKEKSSYKHAAFNSEYAQSNKKNSYYTLPSTPDLNGALYYNTFINGLEELLRLADRNSMAHSVEVRLPFLSHELVEFLFTLPPHFKIKNGWTKWLLRKSTEDILPAEIVWRKGKVGFEPPQKKWMKNLKIKEAIHEGKKALVQENILNKESLRQNVIEKGAHEANSFDWRYWSASYLYNK